MDPNRCLIPAASFIAQRIRPTSNCISGGLRIFCVPGSAFGCLVGAFVWSWSQYITISLFMYEDEKIRAAGELCGGKEGIGVDLLRSL